MYHQIISGKDLTSTLTRGLRLTLSSFDTHDYKELTDELFLLIN